MKFDPLSEGFAADPYEVYAALRALPDPYYYADMDTWMLARYEDIERVALDRTFVRSLEAFLPQQQITQHRRRMNWHDMPNHAKYVQTSLLDSDGDVHFRLRKTVLGSFTARYVERYRLLIQQYVDQRLDSLLELGEFDFVLDLAAHVPGHIIGNVLGAPAEDCAQLRIWSENVVQFFDVDRSAMHKQLAERATTEFYQYLVALIAERRQRPGEDLVSALIAANDVGDLTETELISTCMLILMAGHGSTIDVLGSGMHALLRHPDQMQQLRADAGLIQTTVQEMFRYESPLPFFHRYAAEDVEVLGKRYPRGTKFGLLYGSANRDADRFVNADVFDIKRVPNRHIAFGRGPHLCLGNHLSRLDMEIVFLTLLKRTRSIELATSTVDYKRSLSVRGPIALPIRVRPA